MNIGIIALAGCADKEKIESAKTYFESRGHKVRLSDNIYDSDRYLAGDDRKKISELHKFFSDPGIDIIINARGGYGSIRLINKLDYKLIKNHPFLFMTIFSFF